MPTSPTPSKCLFMTGTLLGGWCQQGSSLGFCPHPFRPSEQQVSRRTLKAGRCSERMVWEQASEAALSLLRKHFVVETPCTKQSLFLFPRGAHRCLPRSYGWPGPLSQVYGTHSICYCWSCAFSHSPLLPSGNMSSAEVAILEM